MRLESPSDEESFSINKKVSDKTLFGKITATYFLGKLAE
jgi:hypothetical protein